MYDALIVGARPAGSSTALLLARQGYRVLLVDKATFPSDVPRGHVIGAAGIARLQKWGILDKLKATDTPAIENILFDFGPIVLTGTIEPYEGVKAAYAPRHSLIDSILYAAAQEAGVEVREGFRVERVIEEDGRVIGIQGTTAEGHEIIEKAKIVIGADGLHSTIAKAVQAPKYYEQPKLSVAYAAYYRDFPLNGVEIYVRDNRFYGIFPTNDNLSCLFVQFPYAEFPEFRKDVAGNFAEIFDGIPSIAERLQESTREGAIFGAADLENFFRKPYGPGWALVGDAGYHKDPYTAQGFMDAFLSADLLSEAIDAGLSGECEMEAALSQYEQQRNQAVLPMYQYTCDLASFAPPSPETISLLMALQGNQKETNRFLSLMPGTVSLTDFFSPESVERILGGSKELIA